jgi:hypothetical protein
MALKTPQSDSARKNFACNPQIEESGDPIRRELPHKLRTKGADEGVNEEQSTPMPTRGLKGPRRTD